jgi:hypothetical protein
MCQRHSHFKKYIWGEDISIIKVRLITKENIKNLGSFFAITYTNWKCANVTPIFKKDSPSNYKNYRPISLINVIGKVMERCVFKHIHNYLLENNIIINNQSPSYAN